MRAIATAAIFGCLCTGLAAQAADTFKADGCYGAYYEQLEVLQIADNHLFLTARAFGTGYVTEDRDSPMFGAAGPCLIYNEIIDGKPNGAARCVRTDVGGDKLLIKGQVLGCDNGSPLCGTWELEGLTGKWIGANGGGKWWDVGSKDEHYILCFDGSVTMQDQATQ